VGSQGTPPASAAVLPQAPGVYRFRDRAGRVLYIGRAVSLRRRVLSYWGDLGDRAHLAPMVTRIARVEAVTCDSAHEAAWLERNLLEHRRPPWNRSPGGQEVEVWIRLSASPRRPGLTVVRQPAPGDFGPYLGGQKVQDLSGGFRRRVQVAKTFMVDTPIVFLDEFSTGMDPLLKRAVMDLLHAEAKRGRTIVLTTQVLSEAEELCDDILIMNRGRQVARGDLHSLKLLSEGIYEVALTFERVPEGLESEMAARGALRTRISGTTVEVAVKADEQQVLALVSELIKRGRVLRVELGGASLEDVFVELTTPAAGTAS
jgi:excinuclease ABC subunit C